MGQLKHN